METCGLPLHINAYAVVAFHSLVFLSCYSHVLNFLYGNQRCVKLIMWQCWQCAIKWTLWTASASELC